jgi:D-amino-acid dehydrogenase
MSAPKSVVIVGGGIVGLSVAYYALRKGFKVTVLERGGPDHDCCSLGNAGMIVPSHFVPLAAPGMVGLGLRMLLNPEGPFAIRPRFDKELIGWCLKFMRSANAEHVRRAAPILRDLHLASRACYESMAEVPGTDFGLVKRGLLMACKTDRALEEEVELLKLAGELGLQGEALRGPQLRELDPGITMDVAGAVYYPQDCHLDPVRLMAGLQKQLAESGAEFVWNADVSGWRVVGQKVEAALTTGVEYSADEYVLAAGAWSPSVARDLAVSLPMQAGKGYSFTAPNPRQLPAICSILKEARIAVTPMGSSLRFAGTMEVTGTDLSINQARVNGIRKSIPRYFPEFKSDDFSSLPVWSGLRPCSPDGLPYIGRFSRFPNLIAATGHAMMGLSLGPVTGKLVTEIISGDKTSVDLSLLHPDRFARRRI